MSEAAIMSNDKVADKKVALSAMKDSRILDLYTTRQRLDAHLACDGFNRLTYSANIGTWFSSGVFIWFRKSSAKTTDPFPIIDLTLVVGDGQPPHRSVWPVELLPITPYPW